MAKKHKVKENKNTFKRTKQTFTAKMLHSQIITIIPDINYHYKCNGKK